jgi:hypothetical protein
VQIATDPAAQAQYEGLGYRFESTPLGGTQEGVGFTIGKLRACDITDRLKRAAAWTQSVVALLLSDSRADPLLSRAGFEVLPVDLSGGSLAAPPRFLWVLRASAPGVLDLSLPVHPLLDLWVATGDAAKPNAPGFSRLSAPVNARSAGERVFLWTRSVDTTEPVERSHLSPFALSYSGVALPPPPLCDVVPSQYVLNRAAFRARSEVLALLRVREAASRERSAVMHVLTPRGFADELPAAPAVATADDTDLSPEADRKHLFLSLLRTERSIQASRAASPPPAPEPAAEAAFLTPKKPRVGQVPPLSLLPDTDLLVRLPSFLGDSVMESEQATTAKDLLLAASSPVQSLDAAISEAGASLSRNGFLRALEAGALKVVFRVSTPLFVAVV